MSEPKGDRSPYAATPTTADKDGCRRDVCQPPDISRMTWGIRDLGPPAYLKWVVVLRPVRLRQLLLRCFAAQRNDGPSGRFVDPPVTRKRTRRLLLITQLSGFDL